MISNKLPTNAVKQLAPSGGAVIRDEMAIDASFGGLASSPRDNGSLVGGLVGFSFSQEGAYRELVLILIAPFQVQGELADRSEGTFNRGGMRMRGGCK